MPSRAEDSSGEDRGALTQVDDGVAGAGFDPEPLAFGVVGGVGDVGLIGAAGGAGPELQPAEPVEEDGDAAEVGVRGGLDLGGGCWGRCWFGAVGRRSGGLGSRRVRRDGGGWGRSRTLG